MLLLLNIKIDLTSIIILIIITNMSNFDKFLGLEFREKKLTRQYNNKKLLNNLANYGGENGDKYIVNRNGEYNGIIIELQDKVYPLYLSNSVHKIYLNIETGYTNNNEIIEKFNLVSLYQKYSNDLLKFIVDEFLFYNNLEGIYYDYPKIKENLGKDKELDKLKKIIKWDNHELIPCSIKVVGIGSLLPESWVDKVFESGENFHKSIDLLDERINKPPVTYLANHAMVKLKNNDPENINKEELNKYIKDKVNIFILNKKTLKFDLKKPSLKKNYNYVKIEFDEKMKINNFLNEDNKFNNFVLVLFEKNEIMENPNNINSKKTSIGFYVSLLQKSIRRGDKSKKCLLNAIENLSISKPYNNPEYNFELVSGIKQLFWRLAISVIEETKLYKSNNYFDIFDLIIYSYIFGKYVRYYPTNKLLNTIKETALRVQSNNNYCDFRDSKNKKIKCVPPYNVKDENIKKFQLSLLIGYKLMPRMRNDSVMIECIIKWLELNPSLILLDNINISKNESNKDIEKICWYNSLDHHVKPSIIVQLHNYLYDEKTSLKNCGDLLWTLNSEYNFRKHKFRWNDKNDLIYFVQYLLNNNKINLENEENEEIKNSKENDIYKNVNKLLLENINKYEKNKEWWKSKFKKINEKIKDFDYENNIDKIRIGQMILSNQLNSSFIFSGRKTTPIYTNEQIKFKQGDIIYEIEGDDTEKYKKIMAYYLNNYKKKIHLKLKIFNCEMFETEIKNNKIYINNLECVKIEPENNKQIEWNDNLDSFIENKQIKIYNLKENDSVYKSLESLFEIKKFGINEFIIYKSLTDTIKNGNEIIISSKILNKISADILKKIICRIETSIEDKNDKIVLFFGKIDRGGSSTKDIIDDIHEGYLMRVANILSCLYGCFERVDEYKFIVHKNSKVYKYWIDQIYNLINIKQKEGKEHKLDKFINTKLWSHQENIKNRIINGINKYNQKGFGDASSVGSGKTLTALSVIEAICLNKECKNNLNFLILVPNTNLYEVWTNEINNHCDIKKINCFKQESNGKWLIINKNIDNNNINLYLTTMGRNRDNLLSLGLEFVIIDECLTVQNNSSKWTLKAFEQVVKSKYGVLMLSATFFRTRFDKLFFMLKMLQIGLPSKIEYLDTVLNIAIGANIKTNTIKWNTNYNKIEMSKEFYKKYNKSKKTNKKESYIALKKFMSENINLEDIISNKLKELLKLNRKILVFAESDNQIEKLKNKVKNCSFYPDIEKDVCIISKYKGTYGINNLVKYDTILMKPPESDKLPQMKGRLDRPKQMAKELFIEYLIIKDTIDEIDLISLQNANNFYSSHIIPLANYYDKYA